MSCVRPESPAIQEIEIAGTKSVNRAALDRAEEMPGGGADYYEGRLRLSRDGVTLNVRQKSDRAERRFNTATFALHLSTAKPMTGGYRPRSKFNAHSWSLLNARRQRGDMRAGIALETAKVGRLYTEMNQTGWLNSASIYVGGETPLGPAYIGYGRSSGGASSVYLFIGTP